MEQQLVEANESLKNKLKQGNLWKAQLRLQKIHPKEKRN